MDLDDLQEKLGTALMAFHDSIREVCEGLTDAEMSALAKVYEADSKPNETHNFEMPIYHHIAEQIEAERGMRIVFDRAKEPAPPNTSPSSKLMPLPGERIHVWCGYDGFKFGPFKGEYVHDMGSIYPGHAKIRVTDEVALKRLGVLTMECSAARLPDNGFVPPSDFAWAPAPLPTVWERILQDD